MRREEESENIAKWVVHKAVQVDIVGAVCCVYLYTESIHTYFELGTMSLAAAIVLQVSRTLTSSIRLIDSLHTMLYTLCTTSAVCLCTRTCLIQCASPFRLILDIM